jgi:VanZ family protein
MSASIDWSRVHPWLFVGLWAGVVWGLGTDGFSHGETSRILVPLLRWLVPDLTGRDLVQLLFWIRKLAHAVEYAVLAVLLVRALLLASRAAWRPAAVTTLVAVLLFAAADESRQSLSMARTGSPRDVLLDLAGAAAALGALALLRRRLQWPLWQPADPSAT